jgi:hypothetical protein
MSQRRLATLDANIITIPQMVKDADHLVEALRYGWAMGAPVNPAMQQVFEDQRAATRATLLTFRVAHRLSRDEGISWEERAGWAAMGRTPIELIEKIVVLADLEIPGTIGRSLQKTCTAMVWDRPPLYLLVWTRDGDN